MLIFLLDALKFIIDEQLYQTDVATAEEFGYYPDYKDINFNEKIIEVDEMSEILSSTIFIPCPNGFVHPETYRLYEALECECIPIVENSYKYYERLFPDNPFLKIDKWQEAKNIIIAWNND